MDFRDAFGVPFPFTSYDIKLAAAPAAPFRAETRGLHILRSRAIESGRL